MLNKLYLFAILSISLLCNNQLIAQTNTVADGIIFQAVATDPQGNPAAGRTIYIKDAILQSSANGQTVYSETFKVIASNSGVFTIVISKGQKLTGPNSITNLDWSAGPYFLNIKAAVAPTLPLADWNVDQQYIDMGTSQFWSVPFALYASNVAGFDLKLNISDTTNMLKPYLRKSDTASLSNRIDANFTSVAQEATRAIAAELLKANATDVSNSLALKANVTDVATSFGLKENTANKSTATTLGISDLLYPTQNAVKTYVDAQITSATIVDANTTTKGKLQLAGDLSGTAAAPTVPGLSLKANSADVTTSLALKANTTDVTTSLALKANIAAPTFTGTVIGIDKTMVGLGNVDNTSDINKPVSTATLAVLNLKEVVANKATTTALGTSDILYPTQNAVKTYVDAQITSATIVDANAITKGKLQLAGDLGGTGTSATAPVISDNAITTVKILDANVTDAKIATVSGSKISGNISGNAANVNGIVSIANGGTGASTKAGAFDALSPMTTSGDILYGGISGTGTRLAKGSNGQILTLASGIPTWSSNSAVPYTGATGSVNLGAHDLTVNGLTIGKGLGQNPDNTALGVGALNSSNISGTRNTAVGSGSMQSYNGTSFDNNTGVGYQSMVRLTNGNANTSIGGETMIYLTTGSYNTAIGNHSLLNVSGNSNTALGADAGSTVTSGSDNTFLGRNANVSSGTLTNATALGSGATVAASNTIQLGNTSILTIGGQVSWTAASDIRLKKNISNSKYGLATVMKLRPVDYNLISNNLRQVGFIAQEVKKLVPEVVTGKEGDIKKGEILGITYANLVPVLTKAIQEQQAQIEEQKKRIDKLELIVKQLLEAKK